MIINCFFTISYIKYIEKYEKIIPKNNNPCGSLTLKIVYTFPVCVSSVFSYNLFYGFCDINSYPYIQYMNLKNSECLINIKKYYTLFSSEK